jgi:putative Mg2+ transporter-C (MgtC) family protein
MLSHTDTLIRLLAAAACGSIIGIERERLLWAAGVRTHMLVCVGSCLIMIVSAFGFEDALKQSNVNLDPSRMAAQVVSGIGFIGAGTILLRQQVVRGLTTAASIWSVAAIGLAVGGGLYFAAGASTLIIVTILAGIKPVEEAYRARNHSCTFVVNAKRGSITPDILKDKLGIRPTQIKRFVSGGSGATEHVEIALVRILAADIPRFGEGLKTIKGVRSARMVGDGNAVIGKGTKAKA